MDPVLLSTYRPFPVSLHNTQCYICLQVVGGETFLLDLEPCGGTDTLGIYISIFLKRTAESPVSPEEGTAHSSQCGILATFSVG